MMDLPKPADLSLLRRCSFVHPDGRPCGAPPKRGSQRCHFHPVTPADRLALHEASANGWKAVTHSNAPLVGHALDSEGDVVRFQRAVLDALVAGKLGPTEARAAVEIARLIHDGSKALGKARSSTASRLARTLGGGGGISSESERVDLRGRTHGESEPTGAASEQIQVVEVPDAGGGAGSLGAPPPESKTTK